MQADDLDAEAAESVFLLYNEQEKDPEEVVAQLRERGMSVYFYRTDFPIGGDVPSGEAARLDAAPAVVVLLGHRGWGPTQRKIAQQAVALEKPIIPALIGKPPQGALDDVGGLFGRLRRVDLTKPSPAAYDELARAIRKVLIPKLTEPPKREGPRFDDIINTLVDGGDADRSALLDRIIRYPVANRNGLAARIRESIRKDFSPGQESRFATAVRDPNRLTSIRSWMLSVLIWLEPLSAESMRAILDHIDESSEPERVVRFWTLAGVVQRKLPYLNDALGQARDDPAPEVSGLAAIVAEPDNEVVHQTFRSALRHESFETAWHVLRILRIFPVPEIAEDVIDQLERVADGKPLTFDALFALANPEMARAARPIILERDALRGFVQLVVREARAATSIARTAFARALSVFELQEVRTALQQATEDAEDRQLVRRILDDIAEVLDSEDEVEPPNPGIASEAINITQDDIGIRKDVETLASVILAREVTPPLAIGLFGAWGSGKSFFMQSIEAAVEKISEKAKAQKRDQFCSDIVQIRFNAWHYVDTSLWASLVSHILDGLSKHLAPPKRAEDEQATLVGELASAKAEMAAAVTERARAAVQLETSAKSLQDAILERERSEVKLRDLRAADLLAMLKGDAQLETDLKKALSDVGAPAALESIAELNRVVEESYSTSGRAAALLVSLLKGPSVWIGLGGIVLFFAGPPLIVWSIHTLVDVYASEISALIAKVTVAAGSITLILREGLKHAKTGLDALSEAKRRVDKQLAEKRATPTADEAEFEKKVVEARAGEKAAAECVAAATARAQNLESRVAALKQSQSLGYFIAERSTSDDYRRHLGLISTIRNDFDGLVRRLRASASDERRIDRIVLYIDDVDRCPPQMVVDILQAVHLLLAYELFVVVVSVDPRWLMRSLEARYSHLQEDPPAGAEAWGATPQDYLEKIFQIPFSVRPMGEQGFARLMRRLLAPTITPSAPIIDPQPDAERPPAEPSQIEELKAEPSAASVRKATGSAPGPGTEDSGSHSPPSTPALELDEIIELLSIGPAEAAFAETLHMLIPTPRAANRFANIYRLLKASVSRSDLSRFEGSAAMPGEFQLPMLLLALLVGHSRAASSLFPQLLANASQGQLEWWRIATPSTREPKQHSRLLAQIEEIMSAPLFPSAPELLVEWLPRVGRYSFATASMFLEERSAIA